jgi:subtilisin family serine protease
LKHLSYKQGEYRDMYLMNFRLNRISAGLLLAAVTPLTYAVPPSDPFFTVVSPGENDLPLNYQWALQEDALNLEPVWDLVRGTAFVGVMDTGIDTDHPDLVGNFRPLFSFDAYDGTNTSVDESTAGAVNQTSLGHGTHVSGIIAATSNNNIGMTGVCWNCSLMVSKIYGTIEGEDTNVVSRKADGINWLINNGAQVLNFSFGGASSAYLGGNDLTCDSLPNSYWDTDATAEEMAAVKYCNALAKADEFDVILIAAAGNGARNNASIDIQFPASEPSTIAVGAIDITGSAEPEAGSVAIGYNNSTQIQFNSGPEKDLVAPGFNILSTFYNTAYWNDGEDRINNIYHPECADYIDENTTTTPIAASHGVDGDGYGPCTGTSMATPHVTGIAALLRSINPLLKKDQIKDALITRADNHNVLNPKDTDIYGQGMPNTLLSSQDLLGKSNGEQQNNRLTPLFSLYSFSGNDYFYTTKPQMAMAAMYGAMQPQPVGGQVNWYSMDAPTTPGYSSFPKPGFWWTETPKADVYILTTHNDPTDSGREIVPLYRLSQALPTGVTNLLNVDHAYATDQAEIDAYKALGYQLDGIEGYIYSRNQSQPAGTVKLYRKFNQSKYDVAIFPESKLSSMASKGYTSNSGNEWIGYAYPNQDSDGDGLIDGYETILGTNSSVGDSDGDGKSDGLEVNGYPNTDPRDSSS